MVVTEESEPKSEGSSAKEEEMEDEEMSEASEQDGTSEQKDNDTMKSKKSRGEELKARTAKKDKKGARISTDEEEMSDGSQQYGRRDKTGNDDAKTEKNPEEQETKKPTAVKKEKAKKKSSNNAEKEEIVDEEMTAGSEQERGSNLKETDDEKSDRESSGKEIKKKTTSAKTKKKRKGKTGVVYLSRIPPHMKPVKLRHLLTQYGEVSRIYLAPEDNAARIRRKRAGGNSGKNFTEGWVEFAHKREAKRIAAMLNGEPMDSRKRSAYHYDLWTIKYLKRFKWDNLTAEIAYKKAVREQKIAAEVSAAKKERDFYLAKVDQARAISSMEERKQKRKKPEGSESSAAGDGSANKSRFVRSFHQRKSVLDPAMETKSRLAADVLAGIFGKSTGR